MIHIKTPYYSAGYRYNFNPSEGIGIATKHFRGEGNMEIRIGKDKRVWEIDKEKARQFVREHNSFFYALGTKLGVIATDLLQLKIK